MITSSRTSFLIQDHVKSYLILNPKIKLIQTLFLTPRSGQVKPYSEARNHVKSYFIPNPKITSSHTLSLTPRLRQVIRCPLSKITLSNTFFKYKISSSHTSFLIQDHVKSYLTSNTRSRQVIPYSKPQDHVQLYLNPNPKITSSHMLFLIQDHVE